MASKVKKLLSGKFQIVVFIGRDANGKQLKKKITRDSEKEVKTVARELEQEIEERRYTNMVNMRASVWFDKWLELNCNRLSPSTYLSYKMYVKTHFKPAFGSFKLGQIRELHVKQYINDKLEFLSPTYVRKHIFVLREIFYEALKTKSPCRDIEIPKAEKYKPYVLTEKEFQQIHDTVKGTRDEPIILLSAWCGLRLGEIFALKWDDISWKDGVIRIDENKAISEKGYVDKKPKSENGLRNIAAPKELMLILKNYRMNLIEAENIVIGKKKNKSRKPADRKAFRHRFNKAIRALLVKYKSDSIANVPEDKKEEFITDLNAIQERLFLMRPDSYSTYFGEMIDDKKLPPIRFHDLRHYHATWMYKQGIPDQYAAQRLGHDIKTLKGIYQHLELETKTEIDEMIRIGLGNNNSNEQVDKVSK
jgi:integrase